MKVCPTCRHHLVLAPFMMIPYRWKCPACERMWHEDVNEEMVEVEPDNRCPVPECEHLEMV